MLMNITLACEALRDLWREAPGKHYSWQAHLGNWTLVGESQRNFGTPPKETPKGSFVRVLGCPQALNLLASKGGTCQLITIFHSLILGINRRLMNSVTARDVH